MSALAAPAPLRDDSGSRGDRRAEERSRRAEERLKLAEERAQARATSRAALAEDRERAREERRQEDGDARPRRPRPSGRKDVVREQRDTRGYQTVKDLSRLRELARRGASITGLAGAFGMTVEEVEAALTQAE